MFTFCYALLAAIALFFTAWRAGALPAVIEGHLPRMPRFRSPEDGFDAFGMLVKAIWGIYATVLVLTVMNVSTQDYAAYWLASL